jgi:hypothetical protein
MSDYVKMTLNLALRKAILCLLFHHLRWIRKHKQNKPVSYRGSSAFLSYQHGEAPVVVLCSWSTITSPASKAGEITS